ncbi:kinase-like protein [Lactarius tabidus]
MNLNCINGIYRLQQKIGSGTFSEVFLACDVLMAQDVVIKLEPLKTNQHLLEHKYQVYKKLSGVIGIPCVFWFVLFAHCCIKFTVQTVLVLAEQLLCHLKHIHSCNFIHCDLKPSNIVMGTRMQSNVVYLINFSLSKEYRDPNTYEHIPCKTDHSFTRMSLAYLLIFFLCGSLLWQDLPSGPQSILKHKQWTMPTNLCHGLPVEFATFLEYSHSLCFEEIPDYKYIIDLFKGLLLWEGLENAMVFDWDRAESATEQHQDQKTPPAESTQSQLQELSAARLDNSLTQHSSA